MNIDRTIISALAILIVVTAIPVAFYYRKLPATVILPIEKELTSFSSTPLALSEPKPQPVFSGLDCPVKAPVSSLPPPVAGSSPADAASKKGEPRSLSSLPPVSMIYSEGSTNIAVIGGQMLREGSSFNGNQVVKIEKTRVQIRSAGKTIWLNMQ